MQSITASGCTRQLVPYTPADMAAAATKRPFAAIGTASRAILASRSHVVLQRAMAAAVSAAPAPCTTPKSFSTSFPLRSGPATALMAAVSLGSLPRTPDFGRFTRKLISSMASAVRPASSARLAAACRPCTKAVQSSTHVRTDGWAGKSRKIRHLCVRTAMNRVAKGQPAGSPDCGDLAGATASPTLTARSALYMANAGPSTCCGTPARHRAASRNSKSKPSYAFVKSMAAAPAPSPVARPRLSTVAKIAAWNSASCLEPTNRLVVLSNQARSVFARALAQAL